MQKFPVASLLLCCAGRQRRARTARTCFDLAACRDEVMAVVQRAREAVRSSAFPCELRAADSPRPLAFISNICHLGSGLVRGSPKLQPKGDFWQNVTAVRVVNFIVNFAASLPKDSSRHESLHCFQSSSGPHWADGVSIPKKSDQEYRDDLKAMLEFSSSHWFTRSSTSPDSLVDSFEKFIAPSLPALAGLSSHHPYARHSLRSDPSFEGSSPMVP